MSFSVSCCDQRHRPSEHADRRAVSAEQPLHPDRARKQPLRARLQEGERPLSATALPRLRHVSLLGTSRWDSNIPVQVLSGVVLKGFKLFLYIQSQTVLMETAQIRPVSVEQGNMTSDITHTPVLSGDFTEQR